MRKLKKTVYSLLARDDGKTYPEEILGFNLRKVVNPLFTYIQSVDDPVRSRAIASMGQVVATLANDNMESARIIMRRLMWSLNDESGGIGWGAPEAMGQSHRHTLPKHAGTC